MEDATRAVMERSLADPAAIWFSETVQLEEVTGRHGVRTCRSPRGQEDVS